MQGKPAGPRLLRLSALTKRFPLREPPPARPRPLFFTSSSSYSSTPLSVLPSFRGENDAAAFKSRPSNQAQLSRLTATRPAHLPSPQHPPARSASFGLVPPLAGNRQTIRILNYVDIDSVESRRFPENMSGLGAPGPHRRINRAGGEREGEGGKRER